MTALVARPPLQVLAQSTMQNGSRRLSARLQGKDGTQNKNGDMIDKASLSADGGQSHGPGNKDSKKRKNAYDEEDDGFAFSRVSKTKRARKAEPDVTAAASIPVHSTAADFRREETVSRDGAGELNQVTSTQDKEAPLKRKRKKMSFSTPNAKDAQPIRRSKRISDEGRNTNGSPAADSAAIEIKPTKRKQRSPIDQEREKTPAPVSSVAVHSTRKQTSGSAEQGDTQESATKIALPFADTPVITRNKAMREGKGGKGDRRSSLGLRGRRASSLIETGNSNALPHEEVDTTEFYKHIESDLMEPRRMRQLLTWCATRSIHAKPKGTDFEDASAKSAVRIIEEELLKELANKSELSDWFRREDEIPPAAPLPERPHPKNTQNLEKISELEDQIKRLKSQRDELQKLLKPPSISKVEEKSQQKSTATAYIDQSLLSPEDVNALDALQQGTNLSSDISSRINNITLRIGPVVDKFADGIHKIAQYRTATDNMAGKVLAICADKLSERELQGRRQALHIEDDRSPGRDLSNVLRGLSKAER